MFLNTCDAHGNPFTPPGNNVNSNTVICQLIMHSGAVMLHNSKMSFHEGWHCVCASVIPKKPSKDGCWTLRWSRQSFPSL